jgi:hypothetical protein
MMAGRVEEAPHGGEILKAYKDYAEAFLETEAGILANHGLHEMAIDLELGKEPPYGPLYSLSATKATLLREYI